MHSPSNLYDGSFIDGNYLLLLKLMVISVTKPLDCTKTIDTILLQHIIMFLQMQILKLFCTII